MFLRKRGRRILLLHSYRDGRGRVCQARLGHFLEVEEARRCLGQAEWRRDFESRNPGLEVDWHRLCAQARQLKKNAPAPLPRLLEVRLEEALSTFLRLWAQVEEPQLAEQISDVVRDRLSLAEHRGELAALEWTERSRLEPRRTQFREGGEAYLETLTRRARALQEGGQEQEACQVLHERALCVPSDDHLADYAASLQVLHRSEEAIVEYQRMGRDSAVRCYNLASLYCRESRWDEALVQMMNGLLRDRSVATDPDHEYWRRFGHLWDPIARWFLRGTCAQPLVISRLSHAREHRVRPRELVKEKPRRWLLQRVLHWDPPKPRQVVARRRRSKTASQSTS